MPALARPVFLSTLLPPFPTIRCSGATAKPQSETVAVGGAVDGTTDGLIRSCRGNGGAWIALIGKSPAGAWELALPNTQEMKNRFRNEEIDDLVLIPTYAGFTPAWPQ